MKGSVLESDGNDRNQTFLKPEHCLTFEIKMVWLVFFAAFKDYFT